MLAPSLQGGTPRPSRGVAGLGRSGRRLSPGVVVGRRFRFMGVRRRGRSLLEHRTPSRDGSFVRSHLDRCANDSLNRRDRALGVTSSFANRAPSRWWTSTPFVWIEADGRYETLSTMHLARLGAHGSPTMRLYRTESASSISCTARRGRRTRAAAPSHYEDFDVSLHDASTLRLSRTYRKNLERALGSKLCARPPADGPPGSDL